MIKKGNMTLTAILASAVLIEAHVSSLRSKMMINFTPGCLVLQARMYVMSFCAIQLDFGALKQKDA